MTSEEAITIAINAALGDIPSKIIFNEKYSQLIDAIEKDSEVSYILKEFEVDIATVKYHDEYESYTYIQKIYRPTKVMSYEQWSMVKEWLNGI